MQELSLFEDFLYNAETKKKAKTFDSNVHLNLNWRKSIFIIYEQFYDCDILPQFYCKELYFCYKILTSSIFEK